MYPKHFRNSAIYYKHFSNPAIYCKHYCNLAIFQKHTLNSFFCCKESAATETKAIYLKSSHIDSGKRIIETAVLITFRYYNECDIYIYIYSSSVLLVYNQLKNLMTFIYFDSSGKTFFLLCWKERKFSTCHTENYHIWIRSLTYDR